MRIINVRHVSASGGSRAVLPGPRRAGRPAGFRDAGERLRRHGSAFRLSSQRRILAVFAAIVIILVFVAVLAFDTAARMVMDREAVVHTHHVLAELQETRG